MIKKKDLSQEDKKTWEDYIKDPSDIYDKDTNNRKVIRKERFKFDLHGFTLDDANKKVRQILLFCVEKKYKELLLITGKGLHSTSDKDAYISNRNYWCLLCQNSRASDLEIGYNEPLSK